MVSEDILWKEKQKTIKEKKSGEWGHLLREKKDYYKQKIVVSEDTLLGWKKSLGNGEWGHTLKRKTKGYQRKKVWSVRTSIEKKRILQTKDCGEWGQSFGMKKNP